MTTPTDNDPTEDNPRKVGGYQIALCRGGNHQPGGQGMCVDFKRKLWCYAKDPYRPHDHYYNGQPLRGAVRYATCGHGPTCLLHDNCEPWTPGGYHSIRP